MKKIIYLVVATMVLVFLRGSKSQNTLERIVDTYHLSKSEIKVYQTNYQGALGDYGLLVTHERAVFPGIIFKKAIYRNNHSTPVLITVKTDSLINLHLCLLECKPEYANFDIVIKEFVYF